MPGQGAGLTSLPYHITEAQELLQRITQSVDSADLQKLRALFAPHNAGFHRLLGVSGLGRVLICIDNMH